VLRKEDNDWVKKRIEYEVAGARLRGRPKKTWREIVEKECQVHKLNKDELYHGLYQGTVDCIRWMKQIRDN